jgi:hypothetical protein
VGKAAGLQASRIAAAEVDRSVVDTPEVPFEAAFAAASWAGVASVGVPLAVLLVVPLLFVV